MKRDALRGFFQRVILVSLPLTAASCNSGLLPRYSGDPAPYTVDDVLVTDGGTKTFPVTGMEIAYDDCVKLCNTNYHFVNCEAEVVNDKTVVDCQPHTDHTGRRPAAFALTQPAAASELGRLFATAAQLESASVHAFDILAEELHALGAPEALVAAARRAAADEVRHARVTTRLARRFGADPDAAVVAPRPRRALEEVAIENAVEGCVRETFGALVATWQGCAAGDRAVRRAMARIAIDETRHAELAWAVDGWARSRLDLAARARLREARRAAVAALRARGDIEPSPALVATAGVPTAKRARYFVDATAAALWS